MDFGKYGMVLLGSLVDFSDDMVSLTNLRLFFVAVNYTFFILEGSISNNF